MRAVFDANIYVSAALTPKGIPGRLLMLFLAKDPPFELVLSPAIESELTRAFDYPRVRRHLKAPVAGWLEDLALLADVVEDSSLEERASDDPDDDKYLATALAGRADVVVTGDKDLLRLEDYRGVRILSPRQFLELVESSSELGRKTQS